MFVITSHTHPHIYSGFKSQNLFTWGLPDETESFWAGQEPLGFKITALKKNNNKIKLLLLYQYFQLL